MSSVLAIISKAIFEKESGCKTPGDLYRIDKYTSTNPRLSGLAGDGDLFLVTVRPDPERLWLVGVLERPVHDGKVWRAAENVTPVRDVTDLVKKLEFDTGAGIKAKKGALGMSLQTPRILTSGDVALLRPDSPARAAVPPPSGRGVGEPLPAAMPSGRVNRPALPVREVDYSVIADEGLRAVLEAPHDDAARRAYAKSVGGERGELISLQLDGQGNAAREAELVARHGAEWMRPLDAVVNVRSARFERGFLSACRATFGTARQKEELIGHPMWSTVTDIECAEEALLTHPVMRSMRNASGLAAGTLAALSRAGHQVPLAAVTGPLEVVHGLSCRTGVPCGAKAFDAAVWAEIGAVGALSKLRRLDLKTWDHAGAQEFGWLLETELGRQLADLRVHTGPRARPVAGWIPAMKACPSLVRFEQSFTGDNTTSGVTEVLTRIVLERKDDDFQATLSLTWPFEKDGKPLSPPSRQLVQAFDTFPRKEAPVLVVECLGQPKDADLKRFAEVCVPLRGLFEEIRLPS